MRMVAVTAQLKNMIHETTNIPDSILWYVATCPVCGVENNVFVDIESGNEIDDKGGNANHSLPAVYCNHYSNQNWTKELSGMELWVAFDGEVKRLEPDSARRLINTLEIQNRRLELNKYQGILDGIPQQVMNEISKGYDETIANNNTLIRELRGIITSC